MADANAAIIAELKKFMNEAVLDFSEKSKDFTRTRILPFPVPALMIPDTLKRSLSIEIRNFFTYVICGANWDRNFSMKKLREKGFEINGKTGITVRTVKIILNTGEVEVLATNLFDSQAYTVQDLKEVYGLRRGIETGYGYLKEELQPVRFSGIRQICIEQDFAANLLLYSLQSLIEKQSDPYLKAVNRRRKHKYRVNKNVSWGILKYRVVQLFLEKDNRGILTEPENLFEKHLEPVRPGRKYDRKKRRPPNSKFYMRLKLTTLGDTLRHRVLPIARYVT